MQFPINIFKSEYMEHLFFYEILEIVSVPAVHNIQLNSTQLNW